MVVQRHQQRWPPALHRGQYEHPARFPVRGRRAHLSDQALLRRLGTPAAGEQDGTLRFMYTSAETTYLLTTLPLPPPPPAEYFAKDCEHFAFIAFKFMDDSTRWWELAEVNPKIWYPLDLKTGRLHQGAELMCADRSRSRPSYRARPRAGFRCSGPRSMVRNSTITVMRPGSCSAPTPMRWRPSLHLGHAD